MMFAPAINVQQINEIFPALIEALNVMRNLFGASELLVVGIDLVLHPTQVLNGFTLARIEQLDESFALLLTQLQQPLFFAAVD
jgi:hypothetical protein